MKYALPKPGIGLTETLFCSPEFSAGAILSDCRTYRYALWRQWRAGSRVLFVMLNPSTADENVDDPTIRKCVKYARSWGYTSIEVCNLFAYRSVTPTALYAAQDPVGPDNDSYIVAALDRATRVVCAWGNDGAFRSRGNAVLSLIRSRGHEPHALALNKSGEPAHPLYQRDNLLPAPIPLKVKEAV